MITLRGCRARLCHYKSEKWVNNWKQKSLKFRPKCKYNPSDHYNLLNFKQKGAWNHLPLHPGSQDSPSDEQGQQFFFSNTPKTLRLEIGQVKNKVQSTSLLPSHQINAVASWSSHGLKIIQLHSTCYYQYLTIKVPRIVTALLRKTCISFTSLRRHNCCVCS